MRLLANASWPRLWLSTSFIEASVGQRWPWMIHPKVCFLILLICCWVVTASLMAEKTNVGVAVFVADNTYVCGCGSDGAAALLSACSLVRCSCSHQFVLSTYTIIYIYRRSKYHTHFQFSADRVWSLTTQRGPASVGGLLPTNSARLVQSPRRRRWRGWLTCSRIQPASPILV